MGLQYLELYANYACSHVFLSCKLNYFEIVILSLILLVSMVYECKSIITGSGCTDDSTDCAEIKLIY